MMAKPFIDAAKDNYLDILKEATKKDLNSPDDDGMTPTLWAADRGNLEALRLIVGRKGDVNKSDNLGLTALHHAAMRGHMDVIVFLVHWGCNVYARDIDLHSALDLAAMHGQTDIVKYLDSVLAEKQRKNPKLASSQQEAAMRAAEQSVKKFQKLQDDASKKAEREQKKFNKEMELQQSTGSNDSNEKSKKSFIKTLTLRIKGTDKNNGPTSKSANATMSHRYSEITGLSATGNRGIGKKIQMRRLEALGPPPTGDFKVSAMDETGKRTMRSLSRDQGYIGSTAEVMFVNAKTDDDTGNDTTKRPGLFSVFPDHSLNNRSKSESDLLDSGVDSYNGEEDENIGGMFNRPEFGKLAFLPKSPFLNTLQSFDNTTTLNNDDNLSNEFGNVEISESDRSSTKQSYLPWDQDDVSNLDDDDDENAGNAVNMFLWTCGLQNYLHIFTQEKIDLCLIMKMTDEDFKQLGLEFGPRMKLREAISKRKEKLENPTKMIDTRL